MESGREQSAARVLLVHDEPLFVLSLVQLLEEKCAPTAAGTRGGAPAMRREELGERKMVPQAFELLIREFGTNASKRVVDAREGGASPLSCSRLAASAAEPRAKDADAELEVAC